MLGDQLVSRRVDLVVGANHEERHGVSAEGIARAEAWFNCCPPMASLRASRSLFCAPQARPLAPSRLRAAGLRARSLAVLAPVRGARPPQACRGRSAAARRAQ